MKVTFSPPEPREPEPEPWGTLHMELDIDERRVLHEWMGRVSHEHVVRDFFGRGHERQSGTERAVNRVISGLYRATEPTDLPDPKTKPVSGG